VYNVGVRIRAAALLLAVTVGIAGCGGGKPSQATSTPAKHNASAYDTVDVCALPADADLQAALGEAPGTKSPRDDDSLKGCVIDGSSGRFYVFITVRRSPAGGPEQFRYDRSVADKPQKVEGVGEDAFSYTNTIEAHVEALDGDLVVRVSFVYYTDGGTVTDAPELVARLRKLLEALVKRI
jgi:hypothetical protein